MVVGFALSIAAFELGGRLGLALGARPAVAWPVSGVLSITYSYYAIGGMEVALAVTLALWLALVVARTQALTTRRAALIGLVASLAALGRVDYAIAVALLALAWLTCARASAAEKLRVAVAFALGGVLFGVYLGCNWLAFGGLLPLSGAAKQIMTRPGLDA